MRCVPLSLLALSLVIPSIACTDGDAPGARSSTADGGGVNQDGGASAGDGGANDAAATACGGKSCVDNVSSLRTATAFDATAHPIVAYAAGDGIRVRRWNDTAWEALGAPIAGRVTFETGFQLHVIAGKIHLVSAESGGNVHIERFDAGAWADVAGSPFQIPIGASSTPSVRVHSASRNDVLHVIVAHDGGIDTFHVRRWDGVALTSETAVAGAAGSKAANPRIDVSSSGLLATAYGFSRVYLTKNVSGSTDWTLGTSGLDGYSSSGEDFTFVLTTTGGVVTHSDGGKLFASIGDGAAAWTPLGANDGLVETSDPTIGYPASLVDATEHPLVVVPAYDGSNVITRVKRFDGTAWATAGEGAAVLAPGFAPATTSAALHGKIVGAAGTRRSDPQTSYIRYDEITLP
jgi:hypothetical protein